MIYLLYDLLAPVSTKKNPLYDCTVGPKVAVTGSESDYSATVSAFAAVTVLTLALGLLGFFLAT